MRFGNQRQLKQVLAVIFAVLSCFSLASAAAKKSMKKSGLSSQVADGKQVAQAQIDKNEALGAQSNLIRLRKQGSLKPKIRKFMTDQQGTGEQSLAPSMTQSLSAEDLKSEAKFVSGGFQIARSTSLYDFQDGTRKDSLDTELRIDLNFWPYPSSLRIVGGYSRDLRNETSSDFADTSFSLRRTYAVGETLSLSPSVTAIAPTSKESQIVNNSNGALRAGAALGHTSARLIGWEAGLSLSAGQNFHQYDTATTGRPLSKYTFNQTVSTSYTYKKVGVSGSFSHKNGWSYEGTLRESFEHTEELGWQISRMFSAALGHTNGGSIFKANAQDNNIELISENSSLVYGALTVGF